MKQYLDILRKVKKEGVFSNDRTGIGVCTLFGASFEHNMEDGFPLITTKKVPFSIIAVELEGFLKGITDKKWYQDRKCKIWNEWARRDKIPYSNDEKTKELMAQERDLGPFYGFQWRHFGAKYGQFSENPFIDFLKLAANGFKRPPAYEMDYNGRGTDQIKRMIETLRVKPTCRKQVVSAWNAADLQQMSLDPCHYAFQVNIIDGKLNLSWNQRSVDTMLGLPFNIASYATLLHLLARELGLKEGKLVGHFNNVHVYSNHLEALNEQINRKPKPLPKIVTDPNVKSIFDWSHDKSKIEGYEPHQHIKLEVAV